MHRNRRCLVLAALALFLLAPLAVAAATGAAGVVNVNTATAAQLELLPRIGPSVAQRIVEHRQENGKFATLEDLMLVRGVGERTFELLKPYVALSGETTLQEKVRVPRTAAAPDEGR
jgi:competence protein ComEA